MAQITRAQRIERIRELLRELNKIPPERHEVARLPGITGEPLLCPVIILGVDEVLLNHRSHRVRAHLEDDPEWAELKRDPHSESAQRLIQRKVREARTADEFNALKESLAREGQTDPGVMTHDGVLVNANTRVGAIRDFEEPDKRFIRVAVLPQTTQPDQLALLELRLQMRKELKVDYSLTNELLFIDELSAERGLTDPQIARELRIFPESERKGAKEISLRLRFLDLIRQLQRIPEEPLRLTFFDRISYEQLREVYRAQSTLLESDPAAAQRYLESFLLSLAVDVTAVHQIRHVDTAFVGDYMLPQLEDDEAIGEFAGKLAERKETQAPHNTSGGLLIEGEDAQDTIDVKRLIDIVTRRDKRVELPGTNFVLDRDDVRDAVKAAIITGIKDKRRDERDADKLEAPAAAIKAATREVGKAVEAVKGVVGDSDFDQKRRKSLEVAFNKLKRSVRGLEQRLSKDEIVGS